MIAEPPAQVLPLAVADRARYFLARTAAYSAEGVADRVAEELALGDLLAILGRKGDRAFRIQFAAERAAGREAASDDQDACLASLAAGRSR